MDVYGSVKWMCVAAVSARINRGKEKIRVTKSITLTSQWVSLSCYEWLPRRLACQRWEISHTVAYKHLSVNCRRGLTSIFMLLSGIGDATKSENPLGNKNMREGQLMIRRSWPGFMNSDAVLRKWKNETDNAWILGVLIEHLVITLSFN